MSAIPTPLGSRRVMLLVALIACVTAHSLWSLLLIPMTQGPDEKDHIDYTGLIQFEKRLPDPSREYIGQHQHPPLPYAVLATLFGVGKGIDKGMDESSFDDTDHTTWFGRRTVFAPGKTFGASYGIPPKTGIPRRDSELSTRMWVYYLLRTPSVILGIWTLLLILSCLRYTWPTRPDLALLGTAAIALTPQYPLHFSTVSNDPWATWISALVAWLFLRFRAKGTLHQARSLLILSALLAAAFLTKITAIGIAVFVGLCLVARQSNEDSWGSRGRRLALLAAGPMLLASWWYIRQIALQGTLLTLQSHADHRPELFRLGEFHPIVFLDVLEELVRSFFGKFGQDLIAPHGIYPLVTAGVWTLAIFGSLRIRRNSSGDGSVDPPVMPALCAVGLVIGALFISNLNYYHFNGRYLYPLLVPLMILVLTGLQRLMGERSTMVLTAMVVWNLLFLVMTVDVVLPNRVSVSESKFERGRVVSYFDSGHRYFDQINAGGAPFSRRHGLMNLPQHTLRWNFRTSDDHGLEYRFKTPDPTRRYQVRIRYPSMTGMGSTDLPAPTGVVLLADSWILHGPVSCWSSLGEVRYPLPHLITDDGTTQIWWENHLPSHQTVGCAEIWFEEAWVSVMGKPSIPADTRQVSFSLVNIDDREAHVASAFITDQGRSRGQARDIHLDPGESRNVTISIADPDPVTKSRLRLHVVDHGSGPWISTKLASWKLPDIPRAGLMAVPDVEVIRFNPAAMTTQVELARVALPRMQNGHYRFGVTHPQGQEPLKSGAITLDCDGLKFEGTVTTVPCAYSTGLSWSWFDLHVDLRQEEIPEKSYTVSVVGNPKSSGGLFELDRLHVYFIPDHDARGHDYRIE